MVYRVDGRRRRIVCLCGSTRFAHEFEEANLRETLAGKIVLTIGANMHDDKVLEGYSDEEKAEIKRQLDELHLDKIALADEVLILNKGGYIGESTKRELAYALSLGRAIRWLESVESHVP